MNITLHFGCAILATASLALSAQEPVAPIQVPSQISQPPSSATTPSVPPSQSTSVAPQNVNSGAVVTPSPKSDAPPASVDSSRYVIGAEDALQITVWREPTLSGTFPVRPDGMISMVLLGDVPAAGMTPTQLGSDIAERLHKFVQDPSVTVQVMAVNSQRIYLIGEVGHVGPVALAPGMSPLQAIASAGGLSPFANAKHIYILRGSGASQQKIPFNYKQALKGDVHQQQFVLHPGDTIVVP